MFLPCHTVNRNLMRVWCKSGWHAGYTGHILHKTLLQHTAHHYSRFTDRENNYVNQHKTMTKGVNSVIDTKCYSADFHVDIMTILNLQVSLHMRRKVRLIWSCLCYHNKYINVTSQRRWCEIQFAHRWGGRGVGVVLRWMFRWWSWAWREQSGVWWRLLLLVPVRLTSPALQKKKNTFPMLNHAGQQEQTALFRQTRIICLIAS